MSITKENIEERKNVLMNDMNAAKQRMAEYDKKKQEDIALLNALTGAFQLCEGFLQQLDNEKPEMVGDDGNDKQCCADRDHHVGAQSRRLALALAFVAEHRAEQGRYRQAQRHADSLLDIIEVGKFGGDGHRYHFPWVHALTPCLMHFSRARAVSV